MNFVEIFRKVQTYANLQRDSDIFRFLKKKIDMILATKKRAKNEPKTPLFKNNNWKVLFLPIFENVLWCFGFWAKKNRAKTGLKAGLQKKYFFQKKSRWPQSYCPSLSCVMLGDPWYICLFYMFSRELHHYCLFLLKNCAKFQNMLNNFCREKQGRNKEFQIPPIFKDFWPKYLPLVYCLY